MHQRPASQDRPSCNYYDDKSVHWSYIEDKKQEWKQFQDAIKNTKRKEEQFQKINLPTAEYFKRLREICLGEQIQCEEPQVMEIQVEIPHNITSGFSADYSRARRRMRDPEIDQQASVRCHAESETVIEIEVACEVEIPHEIIHAIYIVKMATEQIVTNQVVEANIQYTVRHQSSENFSCSGTELLNNLDHWNFHLEHAQVCFNKHRDIQLVLESINLLITFWVFQGSQTYLAKELKAFGPLLLKYPDKLKRGNIPSPPLIRSH